MKKIIFTLIFTLCFTAQGMAQSLTAKVNRTEIPAGETFLLTLDYDGGNTSETPDFSNLDNDFTIYSVSNSYQSRFINGTTSQLRQWQIALMPKKAGNIIIPPLSLGSLQSNPISLKVVAPGSERQVRQDVHGKQNQPRFAIRGTADNTSPYVQQQINYTVTLYDTGGLQGDEPQFMDNGKNEWIIRNLKAPEISSKVINGQQMREIKFFYALFPQKSGVLETPEVRFNGYYLTQNRRGADPFEDMFGAGMLGANIGGFSDMFATRNPVSLRVKPEQISVRGIPQENNGNWWLPATKVSLYSEWEPKNPIFRAGEAVNRTIYLKAVGVIENQLPEINFKQVKGLKQYPEKAISQNGIENNEIVAVKKVANVYIPNQTGKMTLPEIEVNWFNVTSGQMEKSVLPAVNIDVLPGNTTVQQATNTGQRGEKIEQIAEETAQALDQGAAFPEEPKKWKFYLWLGAAFLGGILISSILFRLTRPQNGHVSAHNYKRQVIVAAKSQDLRALRDALIAWGAQYFHDENITNIKDVLKHIKNKEFERQTEILTARMYAPAKTEWDAAAFIKAFEKASSRKARKVSAEAPLPKLYK